MGYGFIACNPFLSGKQGVSTRMNFGFAKGPENFKTFTAGFPPNRNRETEKN